MKKFTLFFTPILALSLMTNCVNNTPKTYTVTWLNSNGALLESDQNVKDGEMPHYDGKTPTIPDKGDRAYYFKGWSQELTPVHSDQVYTAIHEELTCDAIVKIEIPHDVTLPCVVAFKYEGTYWKTDWDDGDGPKTSNGDEPGKITYTYEHSGEYTIRLYGREYPKPGESGITSLIVEQNTRSYIKEVYLGKTFTSIPSDGFNSCVNMTAISLSDTITLIDDEAFRDCSNLKAIELPNNLETIGSYAFTNCHQLKEIKLPNNLKTLSHHAFSYCDSMKSVKIPSNKNLNLISDGAFYGCNALTDVTIPNTITNIGTEAFRNCGSLKELVIPSSVTKTGFRICGYSPTTIFCEAKTKPIAWDNDWNRSEVTGDKRNAAYWGFEEKKLTSDGFECAVLSSGVVIDNYSGIETNVSVPSEFDGKPVTGITSDVFKDNNTIKTVIIPNSVTSIGESGFANCVALEEVSLSNAIETIPNYLFLNCEYLKKIVIPDATISIGESAFRDCVNLSEISFAEAKIISIGKYAFRNCSSLKTIKIPDSVSSIGEYAFAECSSLNEVSLPKSIKEIANFLFFGCNALQKVNIPESVTSIGNSSFSRDNGSGDLSLSSITFPKGLKSIGQYAFDRSVLIYSGATKTDGLVFPDTFTTFGYRSFSYCGALEKVTIPLNVEELNELVFSYCGSINRFIFAPNSKLKKIGKGALREARSLEEIAIPSSVEQINDQAFCRCDHLAKVDLTAFTVVDADKIPTLGNAVFDGCSSDLRFYVASADMRNTFMEANKGWPTDPNAYVIPTL